MMEFEVPSHKVTALGNQKQRQQPSELTMLLQCAHIQKGMMIKGKPGSALIT